MKEVFNRTLRALIRGDFGMAAKGAYVLVVGLVAAYIKKYLTLGWFICYIFLVICIIAIKVSVGNPLLMQFPGLVVMISIKTLIAMFIGTIICNLVQGVGYLAFHKGIAIRKFLHHSYVEAHAEIIAYAGDEAKQKREEEEWLLLDADRDDRLQHVKPDEFFGE